MNYDDFPSPLKMIGVLLLILYLMFALATCNEYKDTPAGEVPKWVDWVV